MENYYLSLCVSSFIGGKRSREQGTNSKKQIIIIFESLIKNQINFVSLSFSSVYMMPWLLERDQAGSAMKNGPNS